MKGMFKDGYGRQSRKFDTLYMYMYNVSIRWSNPGSINTPQKQDENHALGPVKQPAFFPRQTTAGVFLQSNILLNLNKHPGFLSSNQPWGIVQHNVCPPKRGDFLKGTSWLKQMFYCSHHFKSDILMHSM